MNFDLGEDDQLLVDNVRQFCAQQVAPRATAWDEAEEIPPAMYRQVGELGLLGLEVPEELGGVELSTVASAAVIEALASASGALALGVSAHNALAVGHILAVGTEAQKKRYLPDLASGARLGAWALSETQAGTDAGAVQTVARRDGDGWVLSGAKANITNGGIAGTYVVFASTDPEAGRKGLSAFIVEGGASGLIVGRRVLTLGVRASNTCDLTLEDVRVSDEQRLGEPGAAFKDALGVLDRGRINIAAMACGLLRAAMLTARDYAMEREQFGKAIATFQAIQWKLANMSLDLDAGWLLTMRAAADRDAGQAYSAAAARAKVFSSEAAVRGCSEALQIHGGYGYTREFPVERYLRDAKLCQIGEGTSEALRMVVSRQIVQRFAAS